MKEELEKVKKYFWVRKQENDWDQKTTFIYKTITYDSLKKECLKRFPTNQGLKHYALCRWYNYHTHDSILRMFLGYKRVIIEKKLKHRTIDIYIDEEPFDIKLSIYPKNLVNKRNTLTDREICRWLYKNQSVGRRKHLKNRLFILVLDSKDPRESWKIKREFPLIRKEIKKFMQDPKFINGNGVKAGIIKVIV